MNLKSEFLSNFEKSGLLALRSLIVPLLSFLLICCQTAISKKDPAKVTATPNTQEFALSSSETPKMAKVEAEKDPLGNEFANNTSSASEIEKMGSLPLPGSANQFELKKFMDKYRPIYQGHQDLWEQWFALKQVFVSQNELSSRETISLEEKLQENPEKSHWIYCVGVAEMLNGVKGTEGVRLQHDREKDFIKDMKTLVFLGQKNDAMFGGKRYADFNKAAYKEIGVRYFGRKLK
jgi:hypothetical protein